jgi:hypothetical protein
MFAKLVPLYCLALILKSRYPTDVLPTHRLKRLRWRGDELELYFRDSGTGASHHIEIFADTARTEAFIHYVNSGGQIVVKAPMPKDYTGVVDLAERFLGVYLPYVAGALEAAV